MVSYWLIVVGHEKVLRSTTLYTLHLEDNSGLVHEIQAYGIDKISEDSLTVDLDGVRSVFPGAPAEIYNRPHGPIDVVMKIHSRRTDFVLLRVCSAAVLFLRGLTPSLLTRKIPSRNLQGLLDAVQYLPKAKVQRYPL